MQGGVKRSPAPSTLKIQRYIIKKKNFQRQYTHVYQKRLMQQHAAMQGTLKERCPAVGKCACGI